MSRLLRRAGVAYSATLCALFAWQALRPGAWPFPLAPARFWDFLGFAGMFGPLLSGGVLAARIARTLERENRARPAWTLLSAWLLLFAAGEAVLGAYKYAAFVEPPVPSAGDALFLLGYAALLGAGAWFVRVYATSGFPLGTAREAWTVGGVTSGVLALVGALTSGALLRPGPTDAAEIVALAYPVLDFAVLVPTALLLAMTLRFRGGRVWVVWAFLLSGFVVLSAADLLFAYQAVRPAAWVDSLQSVTFIAGYTLTAVGVSLQRRLVTA